MKEKQALNAQEWQAGVIERSAEAVAHWVATTPEDKLNWIPEVEGCQGVRTAYQQIEEMVGVNYGMAALLSGTPKNVDGDSESKVTIDSPQAAVESLKASAAAVAGVVRGLSDEALSTVYDAGFAKLKGSTIMELCAGNMMYHGGQVNYIQMLCGDKEFHVPDTFFAG
jgi:hypothetical protein